MTSHSIRAQQDPYLLCTRSLQSLYDVHEHIWEEECDCHHVLTAAQSACALTKLSFCGDLLAHNESRTCTHGTCTVRPYPKISREIADDVAMSLPFIESSLRCVPTHVRLADRHPYWSPNVAQIEAENQYEPYCPCCYKP
jgi:hypothetical protein